MQYLPGTFLFAIPIVVMIAGIAGTWIRAKHGLLETSEGLNEKLRAELALRDERIADQENRIRVLERIVTTDKFRLDQEIANL